MEFFEHLPTSLAAMLIVVLAVVTWRMGAILADQLTARHDPPPAPATAATCPLSREVLREVGKSLAAEALMVIEQNETVRERMWSSAMAQLVTTQVAQHQLSQSLKDLIEEIHQQNSRQHTEILDAVHARHA